MRILRGLSSRLLPCGCMAGVYETYDGPVVTLIDEREAACPNPNHVEGNEVPELANQDVKVSKITLHSDRQR
jgi:hypothetical protein